MNTKLISGQSLLVDVRSVGEYAEGNVPGSVNIPLDQLANRLGELDRNKTIIVFCQSGGRAGVAKSLLEKNGFTDVTNAGGWQAVKRSVDEQSVKY